MKKTIISIAMLFSLVGIKAWGQVAEWIIPPRYEFLTPVFNENVILADTLDSNITVWSLDGRVLGAVKGKLNQFHQGYAVLTDEKTSLIKGLLNSNGGFTPVKEDTYQFGLEKFPQLSSNQLFVHNIKDGKYYYISTEGKVSSNYYLNATPFLNGYATCLTYDNQEKEKNMYCYLLRDDLSWVVFIYNKKGVDPRKIQFISSVNNDHIAVLVISGKIFLYQADNNTLVPLCSRKDELNLKLQAKVQDAEIVSMWKQKVINGKCGKEGFVSLVFDDLKRLTEIKYVDGSVQTWTEEKKEEPIQPSSLSVFKSLDQYGLRWKPSSEVLPPQFEVRPKCFDDKAIVCVDGKYGMLKVHPESHFFLLIYKGDDTPIPFRHKTFETEIQLDIPSFIPSENVVLEMNSDSGCRVDLRTANARNTPFGNSLRYKATLQIPSELQDDVFLDVNYPGQVRYEQLISPVINCNAKARHYKYYTILVNEDGILDSQKGTYTFNFSIDKERNFADDDIFLIPQVVADSLSIHLDKSSEALYRCVVDVATLQEGINSITIVVMEDGCPPVKVAYEIMYTKPVAKTRNKPAQEGKVSIKKKETGVTDEQKMDKEKAHILDLRNVDL